MSVAITARPVVVVGLGKSGASACRLLAKRGFDVRANDHRERAALGPLADELESLGVTLALGGHQDAVFAGVPLIVLSPGVPPLEAVARAESAGARVVSEVEVAAGFVDAPIVAVTGTNGKSTVVSLLGAMCEADGRSFAACGNLGTPLSDIVGTPAASSEGIVVLELSSFQLERVESFRANVALLLNVTEDHFERYPGIEEYAAAKGRIFAGQKAGDHALIPSGDALCRRLFDAHGSGASLATFGPGGDAFVQDGVIIDGEFSFAASELKIRGEHNAENACAAAVAGRLAGLSSESIAAGLRAFPGLPHRMQFVRSLDGVDYFDDSKATNVGASVAAIRSLGETPIVLIAGGRDKDGDLSLLRDAVESARAVVLLGEAAGRFEDALRGAVDLRRVDSLEDAVQLSRSLAHSGDAVLLAPACSSFDMFKNFAVRGDVFQELVLGLKEAS
ncbi:MAG: UDP-N-acetylmuramoyl-L-alanine--D-glutamate ligase [Polyangiales bacterium]